MSSATTYILTVHRDDTDQIVFLNGLIVREFHEREHALSQAPFKEIGGRFFTRFDAAEFFATCLNHFDIGDMSIAIGKVPWRHPNCVTLQWAGSNDEHFSIMFGDQLTPIKTIHVPSSHEINITN